MINKGFKIIIKQEYVQHTQDKMKAFQGLFIFLILIPWNYKGQEKIAVINLSEKEQKIIAKAYDNKTFELKSITKIDSAKKKKEFSDFLGNFALSKKEIFLYDEENRLLNLKRYIYNSEIKNFLKLSAHEKYTYGEKVMKISKSVWKKNDIYKVSRIENYDNDNRVVNIEEKSYKVGEKDTILSRENYKYTLDKVHNSITQCKEEYLSSSSPSTFKTCVTDYYKDEQIYKSTVGGTTYYKYDDKKRLIEKNEFTESGKQVFQYLYLYDDNKKSMEFHTYRFEDSKFLVRKEQTFYNEKGLIKEILYFGMSENDKMLPEKAVLFFYNVNDNKNMIVEIASKNFKSKIPEPPMSSSL
ncbi:hypothetical protein [Chryseobacterium sp. MYb328]|uniref:hypothetical protein n=1 Tax=Chryseobacterium sp. MYb328 TaxID=2745231 RepID=UPI0030A265AB